MTVASRGMNSILCCYATAVTQTRVILINAAHAAHKGHTQYNQVA